jgi:flavin-dependent dehydrogenase
MPAATADSGGSAAETCDVFVIGGGPAGAALSTFLAEAGFDVVLAEKDRHPRFHIGESLLPHSLPILEKLGVLDQVRAVGIHKPAAEFVSGDETRNPQFRFDRALLPGPPHAYQVLRADFDAILFDRARRAGVRALEGATARIDDCGDEGATVSVRLDDDTARTFRAGFLADASGRSALTARAFADYHTDRRNNSAAMFAHFRGVPRLPGERGGNIRVHLTDPGWIWQIPLRDDITSIGVVLPGHLISHSGGATEAVFYERAAQSTGIARLLANAERAGEIRTTGNFSYHASRAAGPGYVRIGDAFGFIDPIFSTGVHLALTSADEAARAIVSARGWPALRARLLTDYDRAHRRRISYISWFIYNIHDEAFRELLLNPRDVLGIERAIISLLAGDFRQDVRLASRVAMFKAIRKGVQVRNSLQRKGKRNAR